MSACGKTHLWSLQSSVAKKKISYLFHVKNEISKGFLAFVFFTDV